jgi:hypothetical protein
MREWDFIASQRGSYILANSHNVAKRIEKYYRTTAQVLYPPIEVSRFAKEISQNIFHDLTKKLQITTKQYYIVL